MDETPPAKDDPEKTVQPGTPATEKTRVANSPSSAFDKTVTRDAVASPAAEIGPDREFGRYRLLVELGRGGMGIVWKAWDSELQRNVALKLILSEGGADEAQVQRFLREARLAAKLRHPNIVGVLDVGECQGRRYFTAEYIEGRPLDERLREGVPLRTAVGWVRQVADALAFAHERGVVHRDVKPGNILVDAEDHPFVMDFGLAKEVSTQGSGGSAPLTMSGALLGTPQYMSPEQASGAIETVGPPSDQFSLGAVLYEAITRRPPFLPTALRELLNAIIEFDPVPPSRVDPRVQRDLETICLRALEKDPARRYPSMAEMAADLGRYLEGEAIRARPVSTVERVVRHLARHRRVIVPVTVLALLAVAVGAWAMVASRRSSRESLRAERAEDALAKSAAVSTVFGRWALLAPSLAEVDAATRDSSASREECLAKLASAWKETEAFLAETRPDPASQATAQALAGWMKWASEEPEEAFARFAKAREIDPEVPFGALFEALARLDDLSLRLPLPPVEVDSTGARMGKAPPAPPEFAEERRRIDALLAEARGARVWGREGAEAFQVLVEAMRWTEAGEWRPAEMGFTRALAAPELRGVEVRLHFFRALARYMQKEFGPALADLAETLKAWPRCAPYLFDRGAITFAQAAERHAEGGDPLPLLDAAFKDFQEASRREKHGPDAYGLALASAWFWRGTFAAEQGADPRESWEKTVLTAGRVLEAAPRNASAFATRGMAEKAMGDRERDAGELYARARGDFEQALASDPQCLSALTGLAALRKAQGAREEAQERDPREEYQAAIEMYGRAMAAEPQSPLHPHNRSVVRRKLGNALVRRGIDPTPAYEEAVKEEEAAIRMAPGFGVALNGLALLLRDEAEWSENAAALRGEGADPQKQYERVLESFRRAMEGAPKDWEAAANRGKLLASLGRYKEAVESYKAVLARDAHAGGVKELLDQAQAMAQEQEAGGLPAWVPVLLRADEALSVGLNPLASRLYREALRAAGDPKDEGDRSLLHGANYNLACVLSQRSAGKDAPLAEAHAVPAGQASRDMDDAFVRLQCAERLGTLDPARVEGDPDLAPLHSDPRWQDLLRRLRRK